MLQTAQEARELPQEGGDHQPRCYLTSVQGRVANTMLKIKWPDKSTTSYDIKKSVMDISAKLALNIAKVCLGFAIYDVQLQDIYLTNVYTTIV